MSNSFGTPWTLAHQSPLSTAFPKKEYWSGLPCLSLGDFPDPRIKLMSPTLAGGFFTAEPPRKPAEKCTESLLYLLAKRSSTFPRVIQQISGRAGIQLGRIGCRTHPLNCWAQKMVIVDRLQWQLIGTKVTWGIIFNSGFTLCILLHLRQCARTMTIQSASFYS